VGCIGNADYYVADAPTQWTFTIESIYMLR
jgi:hypothetical protein